MNFIRMFFESLRMSRVLENGSFTYDSQRCAEMIDTLAPSDRGDRPAAEPYCASGCAATPKPA